MNKKFVKVMVSLGAAVFTLFAFSTSASACIFGYYQPEEPKALREE